MKKIVLTGGPGAGKSVISRVLAERFADRLIRVPEAATATYSHLGTRWDKLDLDGRRRVQRLIYQHQVDQEDRLAGQYPDKILLLDRGTIDGAAYWPDGPEAYWLDRGTTHQQELARYHTVLWLETAAALGIYDGDASNEVRFEDAAAAVESGRTLLRLWEGHPNLHHIGAFVNVEDKISAVVETLSGIAV